jgi:hypothetical protein
VPRPADGGVGVEADLRDGVRGAGRLPLERLLEHLPPDPGVALRVPGDPDAPERVAGAVELVQQREGVVEASGRLGGVAADDEGAVDVGLAQPGHQVGQVRPVLELPGGQVRGHRVAVAGEPDGEVDRGLRALGVARADRQRDVPRNVRDHGLLGAPHRQHLEGDTPQCRREIRHASQLTGGTCAPPVVE